MIVHVTGSARNMQDDLPYLRAIIQAVYESGANVARNWVELVGTRAEDAIDEDWRTIFDENTTAISRADSVIVEASTYNFYQGYQTAQALQMNKPVLVVARHDLRKRTIAGNSDPMLKLRSYQTEEELGQLVRSFLDEQHNVSDTIKLTLLPKQLQHLRQLEKETGRSPVKLLQQLLNQDIEQKRA